MTPQGNLRALVALSPELHSMYALRLACQLGRLGHLELDLIHVIENGALPRGAGWAPHSWARERERVLRQEVGQLVQAEGEFCNISRGPIFALGRPKDELLRRLGSGDYDMVVLGGSPTGHAGSLVRHLVKSSPVPVLVARGSRPLRRVLLCTDGSEAADRTLAMVGRLLGSSSIEISLMVLSEGGNGAARSVAILRGEGVEPVFRGPGGNSLTQVLEACQADYDLVVLAKAESGGALREVLGGQELLQLASHVPCPVLVQARRLG
jgi:nucleotide-binding universal stress UspA family protein